MLRERSEMQGNFSERSVTLPSSRPGYGEAGKTSLMRNARQETCVYNRIFRLGIVRENTVRLRVRRTDDSDERAFSDRLERPPKCPPAAPRGRNRPIGAWAVPDSRRTHHACRQILTAETTRIAARNGRSTLLWTRPRSRPPRKTPTNEPAAMNAKNTPFLPRTAKFWVRL